MQPAVTLQKTWSPQLQHTLLVVLTAVGAVLLVTTLLVVTGFVVQDLTGGGPPTPLAPEPGLGL